MNFITDTINKNNINNKINGSLNLAKTRSFKTQRRNLLYIKLSTIVILFALSTIISAQEVSLLFFGDIMGHSGQINSAKQDGSKYDYTSHFSYIEPWFRSSDLVIGNLEVTLAGEPFTGYPRFSSPDALATALKESGVNVLATANNHTCDLGRAGLERTNKILDEHYFVRTGSFNDSADMKKNHPQIIEFEGIKLALLNYTYGTNGLPIVSPNIVNLIHKETMQKHIAEAKELHPDKIIVFLHWGDEYQTQPNSSQIELAEFLHKNGVDIIIGSHPHVVQPMHFTFDEEGKGKVVVYSLGNFVSNQRKSLTDGGVMVRIILAKHKGDVYIKNVEYLLTWVHVPYVNGKREYFVLPASVYSQIGVPEHLPKGWEGMNDYLKKARDIMKHNTNIKEALDLWPL
jgi:poly-gamma-glutamate capsule biosynthesis protein CapA/YwtB (metallophosphatase superfamily)